MWPPRILAAALLLLFTWGSLSPVFATPKVDREVFGYLPYWQAGYDFPHWELLTTVAFFAVAVDGDGLVEDYSLWGEDAVQDLVDEAHSHGVRLVVTLQNFDDGEIAALVSDPAKRATAIETCLTLMAMHGADGVNVDFERVSFGVKSDFVTFMSDLKDAVEQAQPNGTAGHVTLAGPAIDGAGAYDYDELLIHTDGIFIMGYDYYWGSSEPGPTAPYADSPTWGQNYSLTWTVEDYLQWGGQENRSKIILGLPIYGHAYNVANDSVPGVNIDPGVYVEAMSTSTFQNFAEANGGETWNEEASAVYAHGQYEGRYVQAWNENLTSLAMKMNLVTEYDLGGVGFWALGFETGVDGFWTEVEDQFGTGDPLPPDPDGGDAGPAQDTSEPDSAPDSATETETETETLPAKDVTARYEIGPVVDELPDGEAETLQAEPSAYLSNTSSQIVTTRSMESGCTSGGQTPGDSFLVILFLAVFGLLRTRER
jgi:spore germination protein YaaH